MPTATKRRAQQRLVTAYFQKKRRHSGEPPQEAAPVENVPQARETEEPKHAAVAGGDVREEVKPTAGVGGGEEELACRYYIKGGRKFTVHCSSPSGFKVSYTFGVSRERVDWWPPRVGEEVAEQLEGEVKSEEFKGRLKRYTVQTSRGPVAVADARIGDLRVVKVEKPNGALVGSWLDLADSLDFGRALARELYNRLKIPPDEAVDVAARIVCPDCRDEWELGKVKNWVRTSTVDMWEPDVPFRRELVVGRELWHSHRSIRERLEKAFDVRREGDTTVITVPVLCRHVRVLAEGGRELDGFICTTNTPSKEKTDDAVAEKDGVYLTSKPLYLSLYAEDLSVKCFAPNKSCAARFKDETWRRGLILAENYYFGDVGKIVKGLGYTAYALPFIWDSLYVETADRSAFLHMHPLLRGQELAEYVKKMLDDALSQCKSEPCKERLKKAIRESVRYTANSLDFRHTVESALSATK